MKKRHRQPAADIRMAIIPLTLRAVLLILTIDVAPYKIIRHADAIGINMEVIDDRKNSGTIRRRQHNL
jgi:hypothetical protein